ncbi:acyltransferase [Amycolatopsis sp. NPDC021455]|uniref:acyltransferase family protein n=1 Tax=Amycolatopsis sp. NPDC021455 TaxID=3154901 RepID=UPI0033D01887
MSLHTKPSTGGRAPAIDGVRGLAALALLTVHVAMFSGLLGTKAFGEPRPPSNGVGAFFVSGMPSFIGVLFVLPAMYLYLPLAKSIIAGTPLPPQGRGFLRRLLRLLPGYYVMYLIVLLTLNREHIDGLWYVLRPILLLQVFAQDPAKPQLMNGMEITWTVPTMVIWYAALPLIAMAVRRFAMRGTTVEARARRLMLPVPVLIAAGVAWLFVVKGNGWDNRMVFWWPQGFAPTIGIGMALAIKLAVAQVNPGRTPSLLRRAAARPTLFWLAAVAVYLVNCARPFSVIGMDAIYSTSGLLVTYVMVALFGFFAVTPLIAPGGSGGARPIVALLTSRPVVHLGKVGFGIYLWHFAVMHFFFQPGAILGGNSRPIREFYGTVGFWRLELVTLSGAVLIATLSYHLVEQPALRWGEQFLRGWKGPAKERPSRARPALSPVPADGTAAAVTAAQARRDTVRANLVAVESALAAQVPAGAEFTGRTRRRFDAAGADLARLWEIFTAYSSTVDELDGPGDPDALLTGRSVRLGGAPKPLPERHITDNGETVYTLDEAVAEMERLFRKVVDLLAALEAVRAEVPDRLTALTADLGRAGDGADGTLRTELAAAKAQVHRLHLAVGTDPLVYWDGARVDATDVERLAADVADAVGRASGRAAEDQELAG